MCGISVIVNGSLEEVVKMGKTISRRGIMDGVTSLKNTHVYFNYLPITDNSAPMQPFEVGQYKVWLNGYISNYKELEKKYEIILKTNTDTELLANLLELRGPDCLTELNGFFAIVYYYKGKIHCITDRYGIKQLYKYEQGETIYICSEVKGILAVAKPEIDYEAAEDWEYSLGIMTDHTIYKGIERVPCLPFPKPEKINISYDAAKVKLRKLLDQSIRRNNTDIDSCVFLSGGVDSGILAKELQPDYCISMDYLDERYSELTNIKHNSKSIHLTMICNSDLFREYKDKTFLALDDYKAGSCYTNFALTELASKFCTVIYSGAGGDELFHGYTHRYNRPIDEVINRSGGITKHFDITHSEYDWRYLKGILVVEDRMSGYFAMETRYPFLDNDLVDFVLSLPDEYKVNKRILKDISGLHTSVTNGPKKGFSNPHVSNNQWAKIAIDKINDRLIQRQQV